MTPTGSETLPAREAFGPTFRRGAIARSRSASVLTSIGPATWSNGSSIRSNNVVGSQLATTSSRPTTWPSSNSRRSGYGCVLMSTRPSTTLADLLPPPFVANPFLAVRASLRWWSSDEFEDGVAHGWQRRLGRWPVDSFFPALLLRGGDAGGRRTRSSS